MHLPLPLLALLGLASALRPCSAFSFSPSPSCFVPRLRHPPSTRLHGAIVSGGGNTADDSSSQSRNHLGLLADSAGDLASPTGDDGEAVRVRFLNSKESPDPVVILAKPGTNLLRLGDEHGVKVPRACRTGLCGTCTASLVDPSWPEGVAICLAASRWL